MVISPLLEKKSDFMFKTLEYLNVHCLNMTLCSIHKFFVYFILAYLGFQALNILVRKFLFVETQDMILPCNLSLSLYG